jgi:dimethylhistidine N-methyltransferase
MLARARLTFVPALSAPARADFATAVRKGLFALRKRLPCRYLYDAEGSRLFESICALDEYYLTRTERAILCESSDLVVSRLPRAATLVELGSGSAEKTRLLIEALLRRTHKLRYVPIDISPSALAQSARSLLADYPGLSITAFAAEYGAGLARVHQLHGPKLVLWLGSNVGNFTRAQAARFLRTVRAGMAPLDRLLMGVDLRKSGAILARAYDDPAGVTARFNCNLLARINRELGGAFDLAQFRHRATYDAARGRVRMELVSQCVQRVPIAALGATVAFERDEAIHTEDSFKYSLREMDVLAAAGGFAVEWRGLDANRWFSLNLLAPRAD